MQSLQGSTVGRGTFVVLGDGRHRGARQQGLSVTRLAGQHLIEQSAGFGKPMPALFDRRTPHEYVGVRLSAGPQRFGVTQSSGISIDAPGRRSACARLIRVAWSRDSAPRGPRPTSSLPAAAIARDDVIACRLRVCRTEGKHHHKEERNAHVHLTVLGEPSRPWRVRSAIHSRSGPTPKEAQTVLCSQTSVA